MYEELTAQAITNQVKELIIQAFSQLYGKDADHHIGSYLNLEDSKNEIGKRSGLSKETINQITALIGEKSAAEMGIALLHERIVSDQDGEKKKITPVEDKLDEAEKILINQLITIISHKVSQDYSKDEKVTLAELKLMNVLSYKLLQTLLKNKGFSLKTEIYLKKVQSIIKAGTTDLMKLINNKGKLIGQVTKIPGTTKDVIKTLNSTLNIMNSGLRRGLGSELISSPSFAPKVNKDIGKSR